METDFPAGQVPEDARKKWLDEQRELMRMLPDFYLAPGIHMRAKPVFEWWVSNYPKINNAHHWFQVRVTGSDTVTRAREKMWWDDVFTHLVPLGLLQARSVLEFSTTVKPYSIRIVLDWCKKGWREAAKQALETKSLLPKDWPDFATITASEKHWALTDSWAIGGALHAEFRDAVNLAEVVTRLTENPLDIGVTDTIQYAEIEGIRIYGAQKIEDVRPVKTWPLLLPPFCTGELTSDRIQMLDTARDLFQLNEPDDRIEDRLREWYEKNGYSQQVPCSECPNKTLQSLLKCAIHEERGRIQKVNKSNGEVELIVLKDLSVRRGDRINLNPKEEKAWS